MSNEQENLKEASLILKALKENQFDLKLIEGVTYLTFPNNKFQPDNGQNPLLCCTLEHLIVCIHNQNIHNLK